MEQCRSRGFHGYSRKSKQELEELLAPVIEVQPEPSEPTETEPQPNEPTPESSVTPNVTLPLREWVHTWVSVCLGIPPYMLPYIKRPSLIR
jgi:hypothetical protein